MKKPRSRVQPPHCKAACSFYEQALQLEHSAAKMLEPHLLSEPIRSILYRNTAFLALKCNDLELAKQIVFEAMSGSPSRQIIDEFKEILTISYLPIQSQNDQSRINENIGDYEARPSLLITNLPHQLRFIDQLKSLLPQISTLDILTSDFEIAAFLLFSGQWQFTERIRIVIGRSALHSPMPGNGNTFSSDQNFSIEREKAKTDDLYGLLTVKESLARNRIQIGVHSKDDLCGAAYLLKTRRGTFHAYLGSSGFTEKGFLQPLQLMASLQPENCEELHNLFNSLFKTSQDCKEGLLSVINHHVRTYSPYDIYLKSLYEFFRGREVTSGTWELQESLVYRILSDYQRDGYRQLLHIAGKYGGALLCDGVGLGKTFIALMLIERLVYERKRVAIIVPKSTRDAIWETLIKQFIPNARGLFGNQVVVYNHTDLLRVATQDRDFPTRNGPNT